jgi:hypothetical protein
MKCAPRLAGCLTVLAAWLLLDAVAASGQQGNFPPPPPRVSPIEGAIDFHVHSAPDVFGRSIDDFEVARLAKLAGMRAIVLKNHVTTTADRAFLVMRQVPGIEVFGGITLNRGVGGVNPAAVEWMHRMDGGRGKVVWLPTFESDYHHKSFKEPGEGLKVAVNGRVLPETEEVLRICARENLVLHTGHVSPEETLAVIKRGRELGVKSMIVTHAMAEVPGLNLDQMKQVAALGGYLEVIFLNTWMGPGAPHAWMRTWRKVSAADAAAAMKAIGAEHFVLGSDLGQTGNPVHPDGYKLLAAGLKNAGISDAELDLMMRKNPAKILGLD